MVERLQVFVSSTIPGMEEDRKAVAEALGLVQLEPVVFELLPAYSNSARIISLEKARECDLFIQLIGAKVSQIVIDEYSTAFKDNPEKVLIFVKEGTRDASSNDHLARIKKEHKYAGYSTPQQLQELVQTSAATWITRCLRKGSRARVPSTKILMEKTVYLNTGDRWWFRFEVEPGDRIRGTVTAQASHQTFDVWLFNEKEWAEWRNDPSIFEPDMHEGIAFSVDKRARRKETWYLTIKCLAWLAPISIHIRLICDRG